MKKQITVLCAALLCLLAAFAPGAAAAPALTTTEAYCIIDADTGLVLAQQNMDEELHPASQARAAGLYIGGTALGGMTGRLPPTTVWRDR